jgi:hypothetical protein
MLQISLFDNKVGVDLFSNTELEGMLTTVHSYSNKKDHLPVTLYKITIHSIMWEVSWRVGTKSSSGVSVRPCPKRKARAWEEQCVTPLENPQVVKNVWSVVMTRGLHKLNSKMKPTTHPGSTVLEHTEPWGDKHTHTHTHTHAAEQNYLSADR